MDNLWNGSNPGYTYTPGSNRLADVHDSFSNADHTLDFSWDAKSSTFDYDASGNTTRIQKAYGGETYTTLYRSYDDRNLPLEVQLPEGNGVRYRYDGRGQRILREKEGTVDRYIRDGSVVGLFDGLTGEPRYWNIASGPGGQVIGRLSVGGLMAVRELSDLTITDAQEYTATERITATTVRVTPSGSLTLRAGEEIILDSGFIADDGSELMMEIDTELVNGSGGDGAGRRYYVADHLGSVRAVVDEAGEVVEARDYYPWGLEMPGRVFVEGSSAKENYTGHELDEETGMLYAGARYYIPALGRWTAVDPLASEFPSWSPYNYVMNNPVGLVDPDGRIPLPFIVGAGKFLLGAGMEAGAQFSASMLMGASPSEAFFGIDPLDVGVAGVQSLAMAPGARTTLEVIKATTGFSSEEGFESVATGEVSITDAAVSLVAGRSVRKARTAGNDALSRSAQSARDDVAEIRRLNTQAPGEVARQNAAAQTHANVVVPTAQGLVTGGTRVGGKVVSTYSRQAVRDLLRAPITPEETRSLREIIRDDAVTACDAYCN